MPDTRNAHVRKLAVMKKCDVIVPDATYGSEGSKVHFPYNSIQAVSNQLRRFCVEEGLDCTCSGIGDEIIVELTNVDDPKDVIISRWPMVPQDKAHAYSTKYALIRTFLIGDGTEGDEAENAAKSGQARHATDRWATRPKTGVGASCQVCAAEGLTSTTGAPPTFRKSKFGDDIICNGRTNEVGDNGERGWANHHAPLAEGEEIHDDSPIGF